MIVRTRAARAAAGAALLVAGLALACGPAAAGDAPAAPADVLARIERGDAPLLLDVRTPAEFAAGHVPGAVNVPIDSLAGRLDELGRGRDREVVVYCERGPRAAKAQAALAAAGFSAVRQLEGHMAGWRDAGLPVAK
jgi:rhodanese-related sulfurtransferase